MSIWLAACDVCTWITTKKNGWLKDPACNVLIPMIMSSGVELIPELISRCGCKSDKPCKMFCSCEEGLNCNSPLNNDHEESEYDEL